MKAEIGEVTGTNVLVVWKEVKGGILELPDEMKAAKEAQENGVVEIAAVGPDCKIAKPGKWAIINAGGRVIRYNGYAFGVLKEHQLDVILDKRPSLEHKPTEFHDGLKLDKTIEKLGAIKDKHKI